MIRAIAVGHAININHPRLKTIKDSRKKAQLMEALEIIKNCNLPNEGPYDLDIITKITLYIKSNITVFSRQEGNKVIYKSTLPYENIIYLLFDNLHYNLITNVTAFLGVSYYCNQCNTGYNNKIHTCKTEEQKTNFKDFMEERKIRGWTYNKKNHKKECNNCKTEVIGNINNHKCFFQKMKLKKQSEKYIIGDFETITNNELKQEVF